MEQTKPHRRRRLHWPRIIAVALLLVLLAGGVTGGVLYAQPLPAIAAKPVGHRETDAPASVSMPWPAYGQSAVGLAGHGILATSGSEQQTPVPTASVAKVMTALAILDKKPLKPGEPGPTITISKADMAIYNWYFANDGSLARVEEGEQISQYDALQAILLPSANNFADTTAIWAYGSMENYVAAANKLAKQFGMASSHFADASGFSPNTVSTANDLVRLGDRALRNPVIAEIVAKRQANIPVAGTIYNTNGLLGRNGINGMKTGNTNQAGGVFLVSAERQLASGKKGTIVAAVMGGPNLETAMRASLPLLDAAADNIVSRTIVKQGEVFGSYTSPWNGQAVKAIASKDVTVDLWKDNTTKLTANLQSLHGAQAKNSQVGNLTITAGEETIEQPLVLDRTMDQPSLRWRLTR